jgi:SAM-dependent methyltransferase
MQRLPRALSGGDPDLWDAVHQRNEQELVDGLYPLRSASERALLRGTVEIGRLQRGMSVVELGCGSSRYLPYLAQLWDVRVRGVDFSPEGVRQTVAGIEAVGASSNGIVLGRIADYVERNPASADLVVSYGLVEHFSDLDEVVSWHIAAVRPGGRVVISAPNLHRMNLTWARRVAPSLFTWHRPVNAAELSVVLRAARCHDITVRYLGGPRLFATPDSDDRSPAQVAAGRVARKVFNGAGEALCRAAPSLAEAFAGERWSPFFMIGGARGPLAA